ncbi:transporter [Fervidicella metallireducens AeB]|uniref:Transporter n=1 Tax=Fervidicella metallireducens AeB TaxID=1403537 RepID=A0A017RWD1_9CLOT|nr:AEC family transporter [Fervidicella metallireducens]EYE89043.1 transporter [Fervidicella metallireducens AeB]
MNNIIFNQITVLFLIMIVGYIAKKRNIINSAVNKGFTELLLNITLPFMIVASFNFKFSRTMLVNAKNLFIISIVIYMVFIYIGGILYNRYDIGTKRVLWFITVFSNCGFMGYPIIESIYGKTGVFYTAIFNIPFNVLIWTVGVSIFTGEKDLKAFKKVLFNPGIISVAIGLIIFMFSIKLPQPIYKTLDIIGSMTTPISMLLVGAMLADVEIKDVFSGISIYYGVFVRLILIPLIVLFVLKWIGYNDMFLAIPVLIMAMPAAANTAIFAEKYNGDTSVASRSVFLSTILSGITIPLIMFLL